jgi:hypothetical protein
MASLSRYTVIAACALAVTGCATTVMRLYDGPPRDRAEIATLAEHRGPLGSAVQIVSVDGMRVDRRAVNALALELLPGPHVLKVEYHLDAGGYRVDSMEAVEVRFVALAGHAYELRSEHGKLGSASTWTAAVADVTAEHTAKR